MTDKEFRRLNRAELIEIIYQLKKNEEVLKAENADLKRQLADRRVKIANAGSIAEATVALSNIFAVAQQTADNYLRDVHEMAATAEQHAQQICADAQWRAQNMLAQAEADCAAMRQAAANGIAAGNNGTGSINRTAGGNV